MRLVGHEPTGELVLQDVDAAAEMPLVEVLDEALVALRVRHLHALGDEFLPDAKGRVGAPDHDGWPKAILAPEVT